jgi:hypothetical protein
MSRPPEKISVTEGCKQTGDDQLAFLFLATFSRPKFGCDDTTIEFGVGRGKRVPLVCHFFLSLSLSLSKVCVGPKCFLTQLVLASTAAFFLKCGG